MRVGLIGWPVAHSLSPRMHEAGFAALGIDGVYERWPVEPGQVGARLAQLRDERVDGANVTVPHKQAVIPHLDALTETARRLGAVNTIWREGDRLHGDNTDLPGFLAHLRAEGVEPAGKRVLVLGAGGAARAVVAGLAQAGCAALTVLNRTVARARELEAELRAADLLAASDLHAPPPVSRRGPVDMRCGAFPADLARHTDAELIVQCAALGMSDGALAWDPEVALRPGQVVYDLVYTPRETPLLRKATVDGARAIGGLGMLVHQGALAFTRWTGRPAPLDVMTRAVEDAC